MRRLLILLDPIFVLLFVAIGRDNHDEPATLGGLLTTAAPFLIAMAVAWVVTRIWLRPEGMITGVLVALMTVAVGMVLRNLVFNEGTAFSFIVVATVFLSATIIGWRALAARFTGDATG